MPAEPTAHSRIQLFCAVQKISTCFRDHLGNQKTGSGTGFWLSTNADLAFFVTNRHNVDPAMRGEEWESYRLVSISLSLRAYSFRDNLPCKDVNILEIPADGVTIYPPTDKGDVVLFVPKVMCAPADPDFKLVSFPGSSLSYTRHPEILDQLFFIGFPGKQRSDATYDLPIVRSCTIASFPHIDYADEDRTIESANTCLVEGLSFAGSSGSPVIKDSQGKIELFGIMSGHFKGEKWGESHVGLSYLTKADSIRKIIDANKLY